MPTAPDLHVHSTFSTYDGMGSPKAVVARAVELGWGAVCLSEHGWMGSAPTLYKEAKAAKIKPILGCEMYVVPDFILGENSKETRSSSRHLTVLALSLEGYQNLVAWINESMRRENYYYKPRISLDKMIEIAPHALHHNAVLSGCLGGELCQCLLHGNGMADVAAHTYIRACQAAFPNFYIEVQNHEHDKFRGEGFDVYEEVIANEAVVRSELLDLAKVTGVPVIITNDSHYQSSRQRLAHMAMLSGKSYRQKAEAHQSQATERTAEGFAREYAQYTNYMQSMEKLADKLPAWAAAQSIESIEAIVGEADIRLEPLDKFSYSVPQSGYDDPIAEVRARSKSRLKSMVARYGEEAANRFEYELEAMGEFAHYLVLISDIVRMARDQGIYTWTRGSAANSLVCFCLRIHEIDPIHYRLLFERFVNPARKKLPDVDIDVEAHRQPDLVKVVSEHLAALEGEGNMLPICAYSTVSNRRAFRMMAEAAGIPAERIDEIAKLLPQMIDSGMVSSEEEAYELLKEEVPELHDLAAQVFDMIGNVTQHACAFVLGTRERPLADWVPGYQIASSGTLVTQYDMKTIEDMGFLKLDLLKLDTLTIMHNVARMLGKDMAWLDSLMATAPGIYDEKDDKTYEMLCQGLTEGVHSFQGGTQRRGCIEVQPQSDHDMIAIQALYRPSGTRTGLDKAFVARRHGQEDWQSINPFVGGYLDETFGIAIFQEQIMEMGFGMGMTGEEIDDLYKAIKTAKGVGRGAAELFEQFRPTFDRYAQAQFSEEDAEKLWQEWDKLQGYTFNRGHASSYGILGLKAAKIKAWHSREHFTGVLERYPDSARFIAGAIAEGYSFEPPDINTSAGGFTRGSTDKSIKVGLLRVHGVGPGAVGEIVRNQPFASLDDLRARTHSGRVDKTVVENLGRIGALESLGIRGESDDQTFYELLKFIPRKPIAFKGCKPQLAKRQGGSWEFTGLDRGARITEGKRFCAKLFWIPSSEDIYAVKTSAMGHYDAHLLTVVDENGIPFDLIVSTKKEHESTLIEELHKRGKGMVICAEGQISMPFMRGGNPGFKLWGIAGAEQGTPQMWHCQDDMLVKIVNYLAEEKRTTRRRAA